jgi:hypothetical protein
MASRARLHPLLAAKLDGLSWFAAARWCCVDLVSLLLKFRDADSGLHTEQPLIMPAHTVPTAEHAGGTPVQLNSHWH